MPSQGEVFLDPVTVYAPGSDVVLEAGPTVRVLAVIVRAGPSVAYDVTWRGGPGPSGS